MLQKRPTVIRTLPIVRKRKRRRIRVDTPPLGALSTTDLVARVIQGPTR